MRRQTTMSLSLLLSVVVLLAVPTVYTLPASTFTRRYQSHFCGVGFSFPRWSVCLAALFICHTDVMPWSDATPWVMYSNGTHDGVPCPHETRLHIFPLWSPTANSMFVDITSVTFGGGRGHIFLIRTGDAPVNQKSLWRKNSLLLEESDVHTDNVRANGAKYGTVTG